MITRHRTMVAELFSQGSPSSSFALLLSSGFHFSIFFAKLKNSAFSSPLNRFSASSNVAFGTSAAPLQFPADRCVKKTPANRDSRSTHHSHQTNSVCDPLSSAQEIPSEVAQARRSYAQGDRYCPVYSLDLLWCKTNFRSQAGPRSTNSYRPLIVT